MAQSVKCLILDFGSAHDLRAVRWSPRSGSSAWTLLVILSLSLSLSPPLSLT